MSTSDKVLKDPGVIHRYLSVLWVLACSENTPETPDPPSPMNHRSGTAGTGWTKPRLQWLGAVGHNRYSGCMTSQKGDAHNS